MYCINCGVQLHEAADQCPLCGTSVCHPDFPAKAEEPLYPKNKMPSGRSGRSSLCGAVIFLYCIPLAVCLLADLMHNGSLDWFGYVAGALAVAYTAFALPLWFSKPNPVIFVPCSFLSAGVYLGHIAAKTGGDWFFRFGLPVTLGLCFLMTAAVTLLRYAGRGKWFIWGGAVIAAGVFIPVVEWLMSVTFGLPVLGWSAYPLICLAAAGGLLIWFGASANAREAVYRRLFF